MRMHTMCITTPIAARPSAEVITATRSRPIETPLQEVCRESAHDCDSEDDQDSENYIRDYRGIHRSLLSHKAVQREQQSKKTNDARNKSNSESYRCAANHHPSDRLLIGSFISRFSPKAT